MTNELDKQIGTKEKQTLTAGSVKVVDVLLTPKKVQKTGKEVKIVEFVCDHPDKQGIKLSNVMIKVVQGNNITIKKDTLWYQEDEDGNIASYGVPAKLMKYYKKNSLSSFKDTYLDTEQDSQGFLCIKAY